MELVILQGLGSEIRARHVCNWHNSFLVWYIPYDDLNESSWKISFDEVQVEAECSVRYHHLSTRTNTRVVLAAILNTAIMLGCRLSESIYDTTLYYCIFWWMRHFQLLKSLPKLEVGWHFPLGCRNRTRAIENRGLTCTVSFEQLEGWHVCQSPTKYILYPPLEVSLALNLIPLLPTMLVHY